MIRSMLSGLGLMDEESGWSSLRRHERHPGRNSVFAVGGKDYPVRDWSKCGIFAEARNTDLKVGDEIDFTLSFKLDSGRTIQVQHSGKVVRVAPYGVAARFEKLSAEARKAFDRILEDAISAEFSQSQVA